MDMHPTLTTVVYIVIAVVAISIATYMFLYTRGLRARKTTLDEKGRQPVTREEGIAAATLKKEREHRTGTIT